MSIIEEMFAKLNKFPQEINKEIDILNIIKGTYQYCIDEKIELTSSMIIELIEKLDNEIIEFYKKVPTVVIETQKKLGIELSQNLSDSISKIIGRDLKVEILME